MEYEFDAELWQWQARTSSWTFVSVPQDMADDILDRAGPVARGFGSLRVEVSIGASTWRTSVFPDSGRGTYVLPVKRAVRTAEGLAVGSSASVHLRLLDV